MLLTALSSPYEGDYIGLSKKLTIRAFDSLDELASSYLSTQKLSDGLNLSATKDLPAMSLWRPELGSVRVGIVNKLHKDEVNWYVSNLSLCLFLSGISDEIELEKRSVHPISISGHFFREKELHIVGSQNSLKVYDQDKLIREFISIETGTYNKQWIETSDTESRLLKFRKESFLFSGNEWLDFCGADRLNHTLETDLSTYKASITDALNCLETYLPDYYTWVLAVLREFVPLGEIVGGHSSQSYLNCPGLVRLARPSNVVGGVSSLIHECSHQYFHLLMWLTDLTNPDAPMAYSVLKKTTRPMVLVLAGYHAFGNILLGLGQLKDEGIDLDELDCEYDIVRTQVRSLKNVLETEGLEHLTSTGKELFLALSDRINHFGYL